MKKLLLITMLLVMIIPTVSAQSAFIPSTCTGVTAFEYEKLTECQNHAEIMRENFILNQANTDLITEIETSTGQLRNVISNTDESGFKELKGLVSVLVTSLLTIIVLYTGYLFISSSSFPEKREQAKRQLKNLAIIAVILVTLGFTVGLSISISNSFISAMQYKLSKDNSLEIFKGVGDSVIQGYSYDESLGFNAQLKASSTGFTTAARAYLTSLQARNLLLTTLIILAPLIVILYYWQPTQEFGKFFTILFIIELFVPALFMLMLVGGAALTSQPGANSLPSYTILTAALYLSAIFHAALVLLAIVKSAMDIMRD